MQVSFKFLDLIDLHKVYLHVRASCCSNWPIFFESPSMQKVLQNTLLTSLLASVCFTAFAQPLAYVPNEKDGTVSVIDTTTDEVIKQLPTKGKLGKKIQAAAIHPNHQKLYVVVRDKNAVAVVDTALGKQTALVKVGEEPEGIDISPDGKWLAACLEEENAVSLVDLQTNQLKHTIATQGENPEHCVFSPDQQWLLASNEKSNNVDVINLKTMASEHLIAATKHPRGVGFSPDGKWAYIANEAASLLEIVSTSDWKVQANIKVGLRSNGVKVNADGSRVYVSNIPSR